MTGAVVFRLQPSPTFEGVAQIVVPGADKAHPLRLVFRHKGRRELLAWHDSATTRLDAELLCEVVAGWSGVSDQAGADVPYSTEAFAALLDAYPAAASNIYDAYMEALKGARRKN